MTEFMKVLFAACLRCLHPSFSSLFTCLEMRTTLRVSYFVTMRLGKDSSLHTLVRSLKLALCVLTLKIFELYAKTLQN
jgi:hypothetical protein